MGIKTDGTLWGWGNNTYGQLGDGTNIDKNIPTQIGTGTNWQSVCAGAYLSVGIKTDGTLWTWGSNGNGQLGTGTASGNFSINVPTQVGVGTNWQSVSTNQGSVVMGIKTDGTLWAWGYNYYGALGDGTNIDKNIPTQIGTGTNWQSISVGRQHSFGIKTDGTLWAWGRNIVGELGDGTNIDKNIPTQIGTGINWQSISGGESHSKGIKTDGTLWAWGFNAVGQLGDGTFVNKNIPTQVGIGTNWVSVFGSANHSLGIKTDGTLWAWGVNDKGALGDGTLINKNIPIQVGTGTNWQYNSGGHLYSMGIKTDGTLWTWGFNGQGRLGDGTSNDKSIPAEISCPLVGIEEYTDYSNLFSVYPIPASNILQIKRTENQNIDSFEIIDVLGRKVLEQKENTTQIHIEGLNKGIYQLLITSEGKSYTSKFIKE